MPNLQMAYDHNLKLLRIHTRNAVDEIDAALFSGDEFLNTAARAALLIILDRWSRRIDELSREDVWRFDIGDRVSLAEDVALRGPLEGIVRAGTQGFVQGVSMPAGSGLWKVQLDDGHVVLFHAASLIRLNCI